jgi:hypothetical protein
VLQHQQGSGHRERKAPRKNVQKKVASRWSQQEQQSQQQQVEKIYCIVSWIYCIVKTSCLCAMKALL